MKFCKVLALVLVFAMVLSISAFASGDMPDTSQGGKATSRPPDNSTKAVDILGTRAALYYAYGDSGYTVSQNVTGDYYLYMPPIAAPLAGTPYALEGVYLWCGAERWDEAAGVGNSGIVINQLTDETTPFRLGGAADLYEGPDGQMYNSVVVMKTDPNETMPESATETAPGVGVAFNGSALELNNVYIESNGTGRPSVHIPSPTRDKNATQLGDLICVDSKIVNHDTRAMLLMGGDVWFLNSTVLTNAWGGLSYDNTSTTMRVVNADVENIGSGGYAIYDAAGCTAYVYGSRVIGGAQAITVCRNAVLTVDSLAAADTAATAPYDGAADLLIPATTADGRSEIIGHDYAIRMHADMSGPDSQAMAYLNNAYVSTMDEDVRFADGTSYADWAPERTGVSKLINDYQSGDAVVISCHNGKVVFDGCEVKARSGVLVHSLFTYDSMASGIYPVDGAEYAGDAVTIANMAAQGDILHEDYMRKMDVALQNASLTGKVTGTTLAAWNQYWTDAVGALPSGELSDPSGEMDAMESTLVQCIHDDTYNTLWGVRMTMDGSSAWTVTGPSQLASFTMAPGAQVLAPAGKTLAIYVGCGMDNAKTGYDLSTATRIDALQPGVTYTGVVIVPQDADPLARSGSGDILASLGDLAEALGLDAAYDRQTGTLTVTDPAGIQY